MREEQNLLRKIIFGGFFTRSMELVGPIHAIPIRSDCPPLLPPARPVPRIYNCPAESADLSAHTSQAVEEPVQFEESEVETLEFVEEQKETVAEAVKPVLVAETAVPKESADLLVEEILMEEAPSAPRAETIVEPVLSAPRDLLEDIKRWANKWNY